MKSPRPDEIIKVIEEIDEEIKTKKIKPKDDFYEMPLDCISFVVRVLNALGLEDKKIFRLSDENSMKKWGVKSFEECNYGDIIYFYQLARREKTNKIATHLAIKIDDKAIGHYEMKTGKITIETIEVFIKRRENRGGKERGDRYKSKILRIPKE
jgi:hypothetical protein